MHHTRAQAADECSATIQRLPPWQTQLPRLIQFAELMTNIRIDALHTSTGRFAMHTNSSSPRRELRTLQFAVAIYVFLFVIKLGAYFVTNVLALLAESVHSLTDIAIAVFVVLPLCTPARPQTTPIGTVMPVLKMSQLS